MYPNLRLIINSSQLEIDMEGKIDDAMKDEVLDEEKLVDQAVKMLQGETTVSSGSDEDGKSEMEQARSDSKQKKRKLEMVDMFPACGKLPNFKKKADALKKKKNESAGPSKKSSEETDKKKKRRTKSFLVILSTFSVLISKL